MKHFTVKTLPDVVLTDHLRSIIDRLDASTADIETCIALPPEVYASEGIVRLIRLDLKNLQSRPIRLQVDATRPGRRLGLV